jgi:amidase
MNRNIVDEHGGSASATDKGDEPLHYEKLTDVARLIESREISPVDLARMILDRIRSVDAGLKSYATVTADRALAAAREAEDEIGAGRYRGALHGMPIAVKDLCYTRGVATMGGLAVRRGFVPDHDATVVEKLEAAGAVLLGKLNLTEGAMAGYHPEFDIPVNPWRADYWSGASSSGSGVATAAGLCFASLGSDTGGSIRFPSMANGIVGLKPTYGLVSRHGILPLAESLDHIGPMTRSVADAAVVLDCIAGPDPLDPTTLENPALTITRDLDASIDDMRIGIDREYSAAGTDPGLIDAIDAALGVLESLGAQVVEVRAPTFTPDVGETWFGLCSHEAYLAHAVDFPSRSDEYGPYFRDFLTMGQSVTEEQLAGANAVRDRFSRELHAMLDGIDALVCPAGGTTFPITVDQTADAETLKPLFESVQMQFTFPADLAGTPSLTVPCGMSQAGIPYALQFMGARLTEATLCRIGHAYEQATRWHRLHPPV